MKPEFFNNKQTKLTERKQKSLEREQCENESSKFALEKKREKKKHTHTNNN